MECRQLGILMIKGSSLFGALKPSADALLSSSSLAADDWKKLEDGSPNAIQFLFLRRGTELVPRGLT
jgi:hypothetical protein